MEWSFPSFDSCIAGIEIVIGASGDFGYTCVILQKKGSQIEVKSTGKSLQHLVGAPQTNPSPLPVFISLHGKGVVHKLVQGVKTDSEEALLNKVLPNSNLAEFYVQRFYISAETIFVSIARKSLIDGLIQKLKAAEDIKIIGLTLGPFAIQSAVSLLKPQSELTYELKFSGHELLVRNGVIASYNPMGMEHSERTESSGKINLSSDYWIAFASAFQYFNPIDLVESNIQYVLTAREEFKNEVKFKKSGVAVLAGFFLILLANFVLFSYLSGKVNSKSAAAAIGKGELTLIDSLNQQIAERTLFLNKSGLSEPSRTSYYADQIAQNLPENITLTSMIIQPVKQDIEDEDRLEFENRKILVKGKCPYSLDVNEWVKSLRNKNWVSSITLLNYQQKQEGDKGEFLVEIIFR